MKSNRRHRPTTNSATLHYRLSCEKPDKPRGDAGKAFAAAEVRHEAEYFIPTEHHNPMELFASTVIWDGDGKLTVYDKTQGVQNVQRYLCSVFEKKPDDVRVMSPFVGGAFGSGLRPQYQVVLAVLGALALQRSVRLVLTRQQMYGLGHRPATIERLALGAKADGTLDSITPRGDRRHLAIRGLLPQRYRLGGAALQVRQREICAPAGAARRSDLLRHARARRRDWRLCPRKRDGRACRALKLDPIELRLRCYSDRDQNEDVPYTSKQLRECYRQGAEAFGWDKRNPEPRSMRDGSELVGWGMATGVWEALQVPTAARIVLTANGHAEVSCAASDIGTGTYTIMAQVAADMLGLPIENITIKLGDSTLPQAPVEGGSWMAASASHAVATTAEEVRKELLRLAKQIKGSPLADATPEDVIARGRQNCQQTGCEPRSLDRRCDAARRDRQDRKGKDQQLPGRQLACAQHPFGGVCRSEGR